MWGLCAVTVGFPSFDLLPHLISIRRILRAFLVEEAKIVKRVIKSQQKK